MRVHGTPGPYLVTILDVSTAGLRVDSSTSFPAGTTVTVCYHGSEMTGQIRYSREMEGDQVHVGIQVETVTGALAQSETGEIDLMLLFREQIRGKTPSHA